MSHPVPGMEYLPGRDYATKTALSAGDRISEKDRMKNIDMKQLSSRERKYILSQKMASKKKAEKLDSMKSINKERKRQGYKAKRFDRASKGLYRFLDKYQ